METPRTKLETILVDSDMFVALIHGDDSNHRRALALLQHVRQGDYALFTSNYVFAETVTVLSRKVAHQAATDFIRHMKTSPSAFAIQWVDETVEARAIQIFQQQASKNVSFVDCTNMALMDLFGFDYLLSFDRHYGTRYSRLQVPQAA